MPPPPRILKLVVGEGSGGGDGSTGVPGAAAPPSPASLGAAAAVGIGAGTGGKVWGPPSVGRYALRLPGNTPDG